VQAVVNVVPHGSVKSTRVRASRLEQQLQKQQALHCAKAAESSSHVQYTCTVHSRMRASYVRWMKVTSAEEIRPTKLAESTRRSGLKIATGSRRNKLRG
jgi:hypothetical protein